MKSLGELLCINVEEIGYYSLTFMEEMHAVRWPIYIAISYSLIGDLNIQMTNRKCKHFNIP